LKYVIDIRLFYQYIKPKHRTCAWLGRRFLNRTFSVQEDDPEVDIYEIRQLLE
jgi:hypothetical protein